MADVSPRTAETPLAERADFTLGDARIRPSIRTVEGPDGSDTAEPRVMQVLLALADAHGAVVSRDELIRRCWDGRIVGDDAVNRAIGEVRRLARATGSAFGVETIPRIGYRLTGALPESARHVDSALVSRRTAVVGAVGAVTAVAGGAWLVQRRRRDDRYQALIERGLEALRYGSPESYGEAQALFEQALAIEPGDARGWGLLAYAGQLAADLVPAAKAATAVSAAQQAAKKALALDPGEPNATTAMIELQDTMIPRAVKEDRLREVLRIDPKNIFVLS